MRKELLEIVNPIHLERKREIWTVVYPAYSKQNLFLREHISKFILQKKILPLNPFMNFNYFFGDSVDRSLVYTGNDNLIRISDEVWVFGKVADGVAAEIYYCEEKLKKPVRYFSIKKLPAGMYDFKEVGEDEVEIDFESKVV